VFTANIFLRCEVWRGLLESKAIGGDQVGRQEQRFWAVMGAEAVLQSPVVIDPEIMSGAPVFRGTRVPVRILFDHFETGETVEEFLERYPSVSREQVVAFLELVSARVPEFAN
jgi:uncharacterized protein (DUF433 family)